MYMYTYKYILHIYRLNNKENVKFSSDTFICELFENEREYNIHITIVNIPIIQSYTHTV